MATGSEERALAAWETLAETCLATRRGGTLRVLERPGGWTAPIWPASQALTAAIHIGALTGDLGPARSILRGVETSFAGGAYRERPRRTRRYFDDNAWMGLALVQLHLDAGGETSGRPDGPGGAFLDRAREILGFLEGGQDVDGGIRWVEGGSSRHACSTAPGAELALRLHAIDTDAAGTNEDVPDLARRGIEWLTRPPILRGDGLIADHDDPSARDSIGLEPAVWTYNQGTTAGALALLHRATGDPAPLAAALEVAEASLITFRGRRLWEQPPVFNAVWLRNLLALDAVAPVAGLNDLVDDYLERAWHDARDPATGLSTGGGIGSYDRKPGIDHAGLTQLFAIRARLDRGETFEIC